MAFTVKNRQTSFSVHKHVVPGLIPQASETIADMDVYLAAIVLTPHATTDEASVTIKDRQSPTPTLVLGPIPVNAGAPVVLVFPDKRYCPNGFTVESAAGDLVTGYFAWSL